MYDHVGLESEISTRACASTPRRSRRSGYGLCSRDANGAGFGPKDAPALWLVPRDGRGGPGRARRLCARRIARRSSASTRRDSRPADATTASRACARTTRRSYYAAFLIDPDGNNVEAVCLS